MFSSTAFRASSARLSAEPLGQASGRPWAEGESSHDHLPKPTVMMNLQENKSWALPDTEYRKSPGEKACLDLGQKAPAGPRRQVFEGALGKLSGGGGCISLVCRASFLVGSAASGVVPAGPALGDVENEFHSDFHWATALKQLQEGTQLGLPPPLPAELLWRNATLPMGSGRVLLAVVAGAMGRYLQANLPFFEGVNWPLLKYNLIITYPRSSSTWLNISILHDGYFKE